MIIVCYLDMSPFRALLEAIKEFRRRFIFITLVGVADALVVFSIPLLLASFTKNGLPLRELWSLLTSISLLFAASLLLQWVIRRYGEAFGPELSVYLRRRYFESLASVPASQLTKKHSLYLLSLAGTVADSLGGLATGVFWGFSRIAVNISMFFVVFAKEDLRLAAFNFAFMALFLSASFLLAKKVGPVASELNKSRAGLLEIFADIMSNLLTVKRLGILPFVSKLMSDFADKNLKSINAMQSFHAKRWLGLHTLYGIAFLGTLSMLLFGISKGALTPSILILFVAAFTSIKGNLEWLSENFVSIIAMGTYIRDLEDVIENVSPPSGIEWVDEWSSIHFEDVKFRYPGSGIEISIPRFSIKKGESVLITGESGQGKTTVLNLVANLYEPLRGERTIGGKRYKTIDQSFFSENFVLVSQEVELFNLSLRENLALGDETLTDDMLLSALREVGLSEWIKELPEGLSTSVGERGLKLSAGQRQRINLVRGLLLDRKIVLLDEPTSHLDSETEGKVIEFLRGRLKGKTAIIVSHKPTLSSLASEHYEVKGHMMSRLERIS